MTAVYNRFVVESLAVYTDQPVGEAFFAERFRTHPDYPFLVADCGGQVLGFAYLAPFHPAPRLVIITAVRPPRIPPLTRKCSL